MFWHLHCPTTLLRKCFTNKKSPCLLWCQLSNALWYKSSFLNWSVPPMYYNIVSIMSFWHVTVMSYYGQQELVNSLLISSRSHASWKQISFSPCKYAKCETNHPDSYDIYAKVFSMPCYMLESVIIRRNKKGERTAERENEVSHAVQFWHWVSKRNTREATS